MIVNHVPRLLAEKFGGKDKINLKKIQKDTNLSYSSIGAWAKGHVERVDFETMEAWCNYLGVKPGDLFDLVEKTDTGD